jgi:spore coat polysaccharide biosynthesis protein SpsF (cytidylyltransferase family)
LRGGNLYTGIDPLSPSVPEVLYVGTLRQAASSAALTEYDREHVTPFFRRDDSPRGCVRLPPTWRGLDPALRLTVDTPDDMAFMNGLYRTLIDLTGNDRPEAWSLEQVYDVARALTSSANRSAADTSVVNDSGTTT